ncbi:MAG: cupredoxin domain-containing protein [Gemmatimonadaceae bacterium]
MFHNFYSPAFALAAVACLACSDSSGPKANATVSVQDECDPATFNAALGAGSCSRQGNVSFASFNNELQATQKVATWQFVPTALTIHVGQSIAAMNNGGEMHSFTEVAQFGGGIVPSLNQASGNSTETPECAALPAVDLIAAGQTFVTDAATTVGTKNYQCCIHPWMRATVTVVQ